MTKRIIIGALLAVIDHAIQPPTTTVIVVMVIAKGIGTGKKARDDGTANDGIGRDHTMMREVSLSTAMTMMLERCRKRTRRNMEGKPEMMTESTTKTNVVVVGIVVIIVVAVDGAGIVIDTGNAGIGGRDHTRIRATKMSIATTTLRARR